MILWRLTTHPGLDGFGGTLASGRWHNRPRNVVYAAEHPALAVLEALAHLHLSLSTIPTGLRLMSIEVADKASTRSVGELPSGWQANEATSRALGDAWIDSRATLLLAVPSALVPHSTNYLINPAHAQAASHLVEVNQPFWFDQRFLRPS